jgi:two-component system, cell cycle response regulator DivK
MIKKVMVVEDNDLNLKLFQDLLEAHGMDVMPVKEGLNSYATALSYKPDLILMDIQLNGVSGFDLIKQFKADDKMKVIPIIAVTAFAMKDDEEKILKSGCEAYISKPISIGPFLQTITKFLNA